MGQELTQVLKELVRVGLGKRRKTIAARAYRRRQLAKAHDAFEVAGIAPGKLNHCGPLGLHRFGWKLLEDAWVRSPVISALDLPLAELATGFEPVVCEGLSQRGDLTAFPDVVQALLGYIAQHEGLILAASDYVTKRIEVERHKRGITAGPKRLVRKVAVGVVSF